MSLLVSSSPTANIPSLDGLLGMMGKSAGGRQLVVAAMQALQVRRTARACSARGCMRRWPGWLGQRCRQLQRAAARPVALTNNLA